MRLELGMDICYVEQFLLIHLMLLGDLLCWFVGEYVRKDTSNLRV